MFMTMSIVNEFLITKCPLECHIIGMQMLIISNKCCVIVMAIVKFVFAIDNVL